MKTLLKEFSILCSNFNPLSRWIAKFGAALSACLFICALAVYISAGRFCDYGTALLLAEELFICGKDCFDATIVPSLLFQIFFMASSAKIK